MKMNSAFKRISFILAIVLCLGIIGTGVAYQRSQQAASAESETVGYDSIYSSSNPFRKSQPMSVLALSW